MAYWLPNGSPFILNISTQVTAGRTTNFPFVLGSTGIGAGEQNNDIGMVSRHLDGSNFLFADGHVKWRKIPNSGDVNGIKTPDIRGMDFCHDGVAGTGTTAG